MYLTTQLIVFSFFFYVLQPYSTFGDSRLVSDKPDDYEHAKEFIKDGKAKLPLVSYCLLH